MVTGHKRPLDVEDVVIWAVRDELPKHRHGPRRYAAVGYPSVGPMFRWANLGGPVDNWSHEPGYPAAAGDPHPDALVVEEAIAGLERFRDHQDYDPDLIGLEPEGRFGGSRSLNDQSDPNGEPILDSRGRPLPPTQGWNAQADLAFGRAELIRSSFGRAWLRIVDLVVVHAKLQTRPPLHAPTCRARRGENGQPAVTAPQLRSGIYPEGAYCRLEWDPGPQRIAIERAEYAVWHAALEVLAQDLTGRLATIAVLPPSAPLHPWLGERDAGKPPRIFECQRTAAHERARRETAEAKRLAAHRRPRRPRARAEPAGPPIGIARTLEGRCR
jgi:hypothetical protein